jgi:hypothetical protein
MAGTVYYYQASYGNLCVNVAGGRSYTLTHINSPVTGGSVTAGQDVGTVGAPGTRGNNGVAHIHFQMWATPNCYSSSGIPFDSAHGTRICGAPDLTASGPNSGNGTWSNISFTGQSCGSPPPPENLRAPSAITDPSTGRNIFYVGADNAIWQWSVQNGAWKNFKLGGTAVASGTSPSAVFDPTTGRNVFYVGSDNAIWQFSVQGGQWANVRLGGSAAQNTSPSAITDTATGRNIFYVGSDNHIWQLSVQGGQWNNVRLPDAGGNTPAAAGTSPSAVTDSSTGRNVFYVGSDHLIWQWSIQNGAWNNFRLWGTGGVEPAVSGTSPTAISDPSTGRNVFYVGGGNQIFQWSVQGGTWHNFRLTGTGGNTPAAAGTSPSAVYDPDTGRNVFYTGSDHLIWQWSIQNGEWNNFRLAGTGSSTTVLARTSPGAVSDPSTERNVFYFDNDLRLWQWSVQGGVWNNFKLLQ